MTTKQNIKDKMLGCLYGQAIGYALGLGSEFMSKEEVRQNYPDGLSRYDQIIQDGHRSRWEKGAWTDDTDMMLCIMAAFEDGRFNLHKVAHSVRSQQRCGVIGMLIRLKKGCWQ